MSVARTNTFTGTSTSGSTTVAGVTIAVGEYALVQVGWRDAGSGEAISGVTFNGSAAGVAAFPSSLRGTDALDAAQQTYRISGVSGTGSVVVAYAVAPNTAGAIVRTFSGVDATATEAIAPRTAATDVAPVTVTSAAAAADDLVVDNVVWRGGSTLTAGAGQVGVTQINTGGANVSNHASEEAGTGALAMSWTGSGGTHWATVAILLKAAAVVPAGVSWMPSYQQSGRPKVAVVESGMKPSGA